MSTQDDRDLERLLRQALEHEARQQEPAGDGLMMIRQRVHSRRRWSAWLKPTLALAGAAAVVAALIAAPSYLAGRGDQPLLVDSAGQPAPLSEPPTTSASPSPSAAPSTTSPSAGSTGWGTPIAGDPSLPDRLAVWPYPSRRVGHDRADADVASGRYPNLIDPAQTAIDFVASYVGSAEGLTATRLGPSGLGLQMLVRRADAAGQPQPVSNVFLARVRKADDSPYVVLGASRSKLDSAGDSLTIFPLPRLTGTGAFTVTGSVRRPAGSADPKVWVALREPGGTEDLGLGSTPVRLAGATTQPWSVRLSPFRQLTTSGVVAAWTLDADGQVLEFVAAPITE